MAMQESLVFQLTFVCCFVLGFASIVREDALDSNFDLKNDTAPKKGCDFYNRPHALPRAGLHIKDGCKIHSEAFEGSKKGKQVHEGTHS